MTNRLGGEQGLAQGHGAGRGRAGGASHFLVLGKVSGDFPSLRPLPGCHPLRAPLSAPAGGSSAPLPTAAFMVIMPVAPQAPAYAPVDLFWVFLCFPTGASAPSVISWGFLHPVPCCFSSARPEADELQDSRASCRPTPSSSLWPSVFRCWAHGRVTEHWPMKRNSCACHFGKCPRRERASSRSPPSSSLMTGVGT